MRDVLLPSGPGIYSKKKFPDISWVLVEGDGCWLQLHKVSKPGSVIKTTVSPFKSFV